MTIQPGERLPDVTLTRMGPNGPEPVRISELTKGRKVVIFALPGAFTPTCSAKHLPGFLDKLDEIRARGVDTVACLSVNDAFVMDAWARDQGVDGRIEMLADGNAEFTRAVGLEMDASGFGMGVRSQRYAMIVNDGVVEKLFVEKPGEFAVSSAEYVLENL
ncbi:MAG: peroxiredoxin [Alphaproteobacteria bacterium]|nr:MAG: peroxiredoxin [Alphaproteobacteria bacterium]